MYVALCGSPSDLALVAKIKSPKIFIKAQNAIEKITTYKREIPIFLNILTSELLDFKKPYSFSVV